jgi:hypothetical protein
MGKYDANLKIRSVCQERSMPNPQKDNLGKYDDGYLYSIKWIKLRSV